MAVEARSLATFRGGMVAASGAADFNDGEWSELFGVVLGRDSSARAQWNRHTLEHRPVLDMFAFDGVVVFLVDGEGGPVWWGAGLALDTDPNPALDTASFTETAFTLGSAERGLIDTNLLGFVVTQDQEEPDVVD